MAMKKHISILLYCLLAFSGTIMGQTTMLEGYVFEDNNRGYLNRVEVKIVEKASNNTVVMATTNSEGFFKVSVPIGKELVIKLSKDLFFPREEIVSTVGKSAGEMVYAKMNMERKPGYIFDVTLAEAGVVDNVDAITGALIEVYNNTTQEEAMVIESLADPNFNFTFERGNHYTVMIRKEGFFNKRLEAYVDVEGCILCFEGVGTVTPGVSDVMTRGFQMGSILANIELESARLDKTIEIENIYYDYNESTIRPDAALELDKIVGVLVDNPAIIMELGSHTDSRGGDEYNAKLSQARAEAAVDYIITKSKIGPTRLKAKGYGETRLVNNCKGRVKCSEDEHAKNRRTELRIIGFEDHDPYQDRSLGDILTEERLMREIESSGIVQVPEGGQSPGTTYKKPVSSNSSSTSLMSSARRRKNKVRDKLTNFPATDVLIVEKGQASFLTKMEKNQLNPKFLSLLKGQPIFLQEGADMKFYSITDNANIPEPLLTAFSKKIALLKDGNAWTIFTLTEGADLPIPLKKELGL